MEKSRLRIGTPQTARPATADSRAGLLAASEAGFALPSWWYTDQAIFELEKGLILRRSWQYAAHTGEIPRDGSLVRRVISGMTVFLRRDASGAVVGFADDRTTQNRDGVRSILVDVWGPMIWVNLDPDGPPFSSWVSGLPESVASHGVDVSACVHTLEREWVIRANWKVMLDNANECYHCPTCHPSLARVIEMDAESRRLDVAGLYRLSAESEIRRDVWESYYGINASGLADDEVPRYHFHWIFPTTYLQYKGRFDFEIGTIDVRGIDRIGFKHMIFMAADASPESIATRWEALETNPTVDEDIAICERVQRSHEAAFSPAGRLLPRSEGAVQHFQKVVLQLMPEHPLTAAQAD